MLRVCWSKTKSKLIRPIIHAVERRTRKGNRWKSIRCVFLLSVLAFIWQMIVPDTKIWLILPNSSSVNMLTVFWCCVYDAQPPFLIWTGFQTKRFDRPFEHQSKCPYLSPRDIAARHFPFWSIYARIIPSKRWVCRISPDFPNAKRSAPPGVSDDKSPHQDSSHIYIPFWSGILVERTPKLAIARNPLLKQWARWLNSMAKVNILNPIWTVITTARLTSPHKRWFRVRKKCTRGVLF